MATNYPGSIDSLTNPSAGDALTSPSHSAQHANANDAIESVQTELGTNPSGSDATVAARLTAIEAGTNLATGAVTSAKIADGTIVNDDINASAAIARSKISGLPTSSTDNTVARFDSTAGAIQTSGVVIDDNNRLTVATGATGGYGFASGAVHLSGTGTPEGVVTATPGSTWLQTDATTDVKGWIRWQKATGTGSTGWVAGPEADTGWRDVTASVTGTASGSLHIRRTANVVTLRFISLELNSGSGPVPLCTFATGFKVITSALGALRRQTDQTKLQHIWVDPTSVSWQAEYGSVAWTTTHPTGAGSGMTGVITHTTTDAWPSSLPGAAA